MEHKKTILLFDDVSKEIVKTNVSALVSKGVIIVTALDEITDDMLQVTHTVVVLEGYVFSAFGMSDLRLYKILLNLEYLYIGLNSVWLDAMRPLALCYKADISLLNDAMLQAAVYQDKSLETPDVEPVIDDCRRLAETIIHARADYSELEIQLAETLLGVLGRERYASKEQKSQEEYIRRLENKNGMLSSDNAMLFQGYSSIVEDAIKANMALRQYEIIFSEDIYQKIDIHGYTERPHIIYLKEQEYFLGIDALIETLVSVFRLQNRQSVKVLRLFDSSSSRRMLTLPSYYKVLTNRYTLKDIETNDFVCKSGDYVRILESLLMNRLHLGVLIVVDCKDHGDVVLSGMVLLYHLCQRYDSFKPLGLDKDNTITNSRIEDDGVLQWYNYELGDLDPEERFITLSARPVIQDILEQSRLFQIAY